jgi:hypothetical protein
VVTGRQPELERHQLTAEVALPPLVFDEEAVALSIGLQAARAGAG